jgi:hypothetical protein
MDYKILLQWLISILNQWLIDFSGIEGNEYKDSGT